MSLRASLELAVAVGLALDLAACYSPSFASCEVMCSAGDQCPDGLSCEAGVCRTPGDTCGGSVPAAWGGYALGQRHTCAADPDGALWCWGDGRLGQTGDDVLARGGTPLKTELGGVRAVAAGFAHSCAIVGDAGQLVCAGYNGHGQLGDGTESDLADARFDPVDGPADSWSQVSAGGDVTCAVRGDELWCFGRNDSGQVGRADTPGESCSPCTVLEPFQLAGAWSQVAVGYSHACAIATDGEVWCWGWNGAGEADLLGTTSDADQQPEPGLVGGLAGCSALSAGDDFTCALCGDGQLFCWGDDGNQQIGTGAAFVAEPVQLGGAERFASVATGADFSCAVTQVEGRLLCWGLNARGQNGAGDLEYRHDAPVEVAPSGGWVEVRAGDSYACASRLDGNLYCWGGNAHGQLGQGGPADELVPHQVGGDSDWDAVSAGGYHTCARKLDGSLHCFGENTRGQLGVGGDAVLLATPTVVALADVGAVAAGLDHTCALSGTDAYCWGSDDGGKLGRGTLVADQREPLPVVAPAEGAVEFDTLGVGEATTCAMSGGITYCWGAGEQGQRGDGSLVRDQPTPTLAVLVAPSPLGRVTLGAGFGCVVTPAIDDGLQCFGADGDGQRGDGAAVAAPDSASLVGTAAGTAFVAVAAGHDFACAIPVMDRSLWCWGSDGYGATGTDDGGAVTSPRQVGSAIDWSAIGGGRFHACGLHDGGAAECWGTATNGQLGRGDDEFGSGPAPVMGGHLFTSLAVGWEHTCAVDGDGALWCWGLGEYGQLGDGDSLSPVPVAIGRPE